MTPTQATPSGSEAAEALAHARWIAEREDYTFAECSLAEEIVARARKIVTLLEGAPATAEPCEDAPR